MLLSHKGISIIHIFVKTYEEEKRGGEERKRFVSLAHVASNVVTGKNIYAKSS